MSILNVNRIQPVGSGQTVTINAANISAGSATLTAGTFSGNLSGNVTGNLTGSVNLTTGITTVAAGSASAPSITPTGDSNTGIFFPSADTVCIAEGGTEVLRIHNLGRVLVGTANTDIAGAPSNKGAKQFIYTADGDGEWALQARNDSSTGNGFFLRAGNSSTTYTARFTGYDENNVHLNVDGLGRVTTPKQPAFYTVGTNYTQATGTSIIIPNVVSYNQGSHYNGTTGRFTAPIAGIYIFGFWGLSYPHGTEVNQIRGFVNGSGAGQEVQFNGTASNHEECSGSLLLNLNANDIFDWRYARGSGTAAAYGSQWNMWGYLLG